MRVTQGGYGGKRGRLLTATDASPDRSVVLPVEASAGRPQLYAALCGFHVYEVAAAFESVSRNLNPLSSVAPPPQIKRQ